MPVLSHFVTLLIQLVGKLGYIGIFFIIGLEYACFPIPSEVILPFVGMSIPQTHLHFLPAFLVSILAGLTGSFICYGIGQIGGDALFKWLFQKSSQFKKAVTTFNHWFDTYGHWAVLFSRVIPLTRTYISLFAGVNHMPLARFSLYSLTGIAAWNLMLMSLGFYLGSNWDSINTILNTYTHIILTFLAIAICFYFIRKYFASKKVKIEK